MPPENDTIRRKRDLEFQSRVLSALEKPNENRFWAFLNKPFTLWFFSLLLLSAGGSYFSAYRQCQQDAYAQIEQFAKLEKEVTERDDHIRKIIFDNQTIAAMRDDLSRPYYFYPEFKDYSLRALREAYDDSAGRIINYKPDSSWLTSDKETLKFLEIRYGEIPPSVTDDDITALRHFARKVPYSNGYVTVSVHPRSALYRPACDLKQLFQRTIIGDPAEIVQQIGVIDWFSFLRQPPIGVIVEGKPLN